MSLSSHSSACIPESTSIRSLSSSVSRWVRLVSDVLRPTVSFSVHLDMYYQVYQEEKDTAHGPMWVPGMEKKEWEKQNRAFCLLDGTTNIEEMMRERQMDSYDELYAWSIAEKDAFWDHAIQKTGIVFEQKYSQVFGNQGLSQDEAIKAPIYLQGARMNIVDSCFNVQDLNQTAIVYAQENEPRNLKYWSFEKLLQMTNQIARALKEKLKLKHGDTVGICMPMTPESIAIYLGVIKAGCAIVSIADSFSTQEIETRMHLGNSKIIFTQDCIFRHEKVLPLFDRVVAAGIETIVILPGHGEDLYPSIQKRASDFSFSELLKNVSMEFESVSCDAQDVCNVLFSSGTTGEPKVIPWYHCTPIKSIVDGYYHLNIKPGEVIAWPTNIGWMMGPWLVYQLANRATIALFVGLSTSSDFCHFVDAAKVSMLGVVPSLVKQWQTHDHTRNCDWSNIKRFASTGESSSVEAMLWLSSRAGYKPVIEYCGGTEIGGAYISATMIQPNIPSCFSTPALGSELMLLDGNNQQSFEVGELALVPPALGLSTRLLNKNHHEIYFNGMPLGPYGKIIRRHGDEMQILKVSGYYRALGRCDDTMNVGGIKVSSIEIERACNRVTGVSETAAIAVSPADGGPSSLVVFAVLKDKNVAQEQNLSIQLRGLMQKSIKDTLNPLFGISEVVLTDTLPRTASNKVMRRVLRDQYMHLKGLERRASVRNRLFSM